MKPGCSFGSKSNVNAPVWHCSRLVASVDSGWAAASRIGDAAAAMFYCRKDLKRLTQTQASDYTPIYLQGGLLTVAACGPAALLMATHSWSPNTPLLQIFAAIALGVMVWTLGLWLLRHPLFREVDSLSRHLLPAAGQHQALILRTEHRRHEPGERGGQGGDGAFYPGFD